MKTEANYIKEFLKKTFSENNMSSAILAVSGGIDSAVSLTLLSQSLSPESIFPVLMPYGDQDMTDAVEICKFNKIPKKNITTKNIKSIVDGICTSLNIPDSEVLRRGNIMARARMIILFDIAKNKKGLVVGTENKSEHYLGYFTRFGDEASDIEPIIHLYKKQVNQLGQYLEIPHSILDKAPSANLWDGQTDEQELGFTYKEADAVLKEIVENKKKAKEIDIPGISQEIVRKIVDRFQKQAFKRQVPYKPDK